jgi:hypothetical protein
MQPTGIIFAALDCDADAIEAWNRWYDLEHTPPNLLLDGVVQSRRYVAPPALHAGRVATDDSPFAGGRATFLTVYTLTGDPATAFAGKTGLRDMLEGAGRMAFPPDKKAVREGDVFRGVAAVADPKTRCVPDDTPYLGHTGVVVVQRRGASDAARERAGRLVKVDGVHGVWTLASNTRDGLELDLAFVEGDAAAVARAMRDAEPHDPATTVLVDAPFQLIDSLRYPWADDIRASSLPKTID